MNKKFATLLSRGQATLMAAQKEPQKAILMATENYLPFYVSTTNEVYYINQKQW